MAAETLAQEINSLTEQQKQAVQAFIEFLKRKEQAPPSPFLSAVDEFIDQHPELLRRLAR